MGSGASVQSLSAQDIGDFVASLGAAFEPYRTVIIENGFSGEVLGDITQEAELNEMLDSMNITNALHRKLLYKKFTTVGLMSPQMTLQLPSRVSTPKSAAQTPVNAHQIHDRLTKSPREILTEMFKIQGIRLDPQDMHDACGKIMSAARRSLSSILNNADYEYDCFISYRVSSDVDIAEKLYLYLKTEGISAFFDKRCLKDGEDWKTGFINGLLKSRCFVSLISSGALAPCRNITLNHEGDNYLIEMEAALSVRMMTENSQFIVPVFIGESNGNVLKKFHDFSPEMYSDSLHAQKVATRAPAAAVVKHTANADISSPRVIQTSQHSPAVVQTVTTSAASPATTTASVNVTNKGAAVPSRFFSGPAAPLQPSGSAIVTKQFVSGTYTGEVSKEGHRQGKGRMDLENGDKFEGMWVSDKRCGQGKLVRANGEVYEGHWEGDYLTGMGSIHYSSGDVYEGELVNTRANGRGVFRYADGKRYEGQWRDSRKHGTGTMTFPNSGQSYTGEWCEDVFHGQGRYQYASGNVYEGQYCRGVMEGVGTITYTSGNYYTGEFHQGKKHGQGRQCVNGEVEEGTWINDVKQQ